MSLEHIYDPDELSIEEEEFEEEAVDEIENEEPGFEVPEKFRDADRDTVIKSYLELEKTYGRSSQELGELRKLADTFLRQELERGSKSPVEEEDVGITFDDVITDPKESIGKVVEPRIKQLESRLSEYEKQIAMTEFMKKHPDVKEIGADPAFAEWIQSSPYRFRQFQLADQQNDFEVADELLTEWKDRKSFLEQTKSSRKEEKLRKRDEDLKNLSVESGSSGETSKKIYRRVDLINLRNTDPDRFDAMYDEIALAYQEGRVK